MERPTIQLSVHLQNAQSIDDIAKIINMGTSLFNNNELAAQYIYICAKNQESMQDMLARCDIIKKAGAVFDFYEVLSVIFDYYNPKF